MEQLSVMACCAVCNNKANISLQGIFIMGKYICPDCEAKIKNSNPEKGDYDCLVAAIKKIWQK